MKRSEMIGVMVDAYNLINNRHPQPFNEDVANFILCNMEYDPNFLKWESEDGGTLGQVGEKESTETIGVSS